MQELSDYQRRVLLKNPNVEKITEKHILYSAKFKVKALKEYFNGKSANKIFEEAGINPKFFVKKYCNSCLKRWKKKSIEQGNESFKVDARGSCTPGRPRKENLDDYSYEELQAIIEIQSEVIEGLKKKRALAKKKY